MFPCKRNVLNLGNGMILHSNPLYSKYVAAFTSLSDDINKVPKTHDELSNKDDTTSVEGSEGSYGGFGIFSSEDEAEEGSQGWYGGSGIHPNRGGKSGEIRSNGGDGRRTEDMDGGDAAETAKAGVVGAMETGLKVGEMAKQTMDGMWDAAKKTTDQNVRDAVADDDRDRRQPSDEHVEDLRRWGRGTDLKG